MYFWKKNIRNIRLNEVNNVAELENNYNPVIKPLKYKVFKDNHNKSLVLDSLFQTLINSNFTFLIAMMRL